MKKLLIVAIVFASFFTQAQNFKFGKVSKDELAETAHPKSPEANAAVLFKKQYTRFEFSQNNGFTKETRHHERIKIYNKEGYDWATKRVRLYDEDKSSSEDVRELKGYTYTLTNGKVEKVKLKSEGAFEEKTNKYWSTKTFTMPALSEGCVIEFEYVVKSPFIKIDDVILQYDIPINTLEVDIVTPEYYNYNKLVNLKAAFTPNILESKKNRTEDISSRDRSSNRVGASGTFVSSSVNTSKFNFSENVVKIYEKDIPALVEEPFTDNIDNYRAKVAFEYAYYRGPDLQLKSYATTWEKVAKTIYKSDNFGLQLDKNNYYKEDIDNLIANSGSNLETVGLIFDFVKSKVKWNGYLGIYSEKGVKKAYKEGDGNIADVNLMLTSMLRHANIDANPVVLSTRDNGIPLFPTRSGFNYVVTGVQLDQGFILLDAAHKYAKPNVLSIDALNWQGRLIREDRTSVWIPLTPQMASKESVMISASLNEDLSVSGKLRRVFTNYQAYGYRDRNTSKDKETLIQNIETDNAGLIISNLEYKDLDNVYKPVTQSYEYTYDGAAEKIGESVYLSPLMFLTSDENPFTQDSRNYPIDFIYPISDRYMVNINIPEGYQIEALPENASMKFNNDALSFSYLVKQIGSTLQLVVNLEIKNTLILPSDYENFKKFYQSLIDKKSEKIVLKKG